MDAAALVAEARRRGLELYLDGERLKARPSSRLDEAFRDTLKRHREEIRAYLASGWPCSSCGGYSGHALACPHGPGPTDGPSPEDLLAVAATLEWPELRVGRYFIAGKRAAWEAFARVPRPEKLVVALEALERFEATWRAGAPTPAEVGA